MAQRHSFGGSNPLLSSVETTRPVRLRANSLPSDGFVVSRSADQTSRSPARASQSVVSKLTTSSVKT
jgi:hypothetical protein